MRWLTEVAKVLLLELRAEITQLLLVLGLWVLLGWLTSEREASRGRGPHGGQGKAEGEPLVYLITKREDTFTVCHWCKIPSFIKREAFLSVRLLGNCKIFNFASGTISAVTYTWANEPVM